MDFHDFPTILGRSGKYEIHPPKLCASLARYTNSDTPASGVPSRLGEIVHALPARVLPLAGDAVLLELLADLRVAAHGHLECPLADMLPTLRVLWRCLTMSRCAPM